MPESGPRFPTVMTSDATPPSATITKLLCSDNYVLRIESVTCAAALPRRRMSVFGRAERDRADGDIRTRPRRRPRRVVLPEGGADPPVRRPRGLHPHAHGPRRARAS